MADDFEAAEKSLNVLNEVFQLGSSYSDVSKIITVSGTLASAVPVVGALLVGLIGGIVSSARHKEIIARFDQLDNKIDQLSRDIEQLRNLIILEIAGLQYSKDMGHIELGMQYCLAIGKASRNDERMWYQVKLKALCANEQCTFALKSILDGVIGNGILRSNSMLDKLYGMTEGSRPQISALGTRLLQVAKGGMVVISTYETMIHGEKGAAHITKSFYSRLNEAFNKVKSVLDRCVKNFGANMLSDLNKQLDKGGSNRVLVANISTFMSDKYDWLENYCLVYNDLRGFDKHTFSGNRVSSLHRNGKCGIVFYRKKSEAPKFSNRYDEAFDIVDSTFCLKAQDCHNNILAKTKRRGIQWTGCAVIKGNPDLWTAGNFSTKVLFVNTPTSTSITTFFSARQKGKVILLLK